jgi:hypothetical protein
VRGNTLREKFGYTPERSETVSLGLGSLAKKRRKLVLTPSMRRPVSVKQFFLFVVFFRSFFSY